MKTLKFFEKLVPLIESGQKTTTFRLFDDKDLQVGDVVTLFVTETGYQFGVVTITNVQVKTLGAFVESDWQGHERYDSEEEMYTQFRKFYGDNVGPDTAVKIINFIFKQKLYNKCVVVDENDIVIGVEYMVNAIKKGLIRRAARVYVFNESGELLVQQRSANVLKPLLLDQSAAGHVDEGETYLEAAKRELFEELGLSEYELTEIAGSFRTINFFNAIYKLVVPDNTQINFDPEELEQVMWMNIKDIDSQMSKTPEIFTPAFLEIWTLLREKLISSN